MDIPNPVKLKRRVSEKTVEAYLRKRVKDIGGVSYKWTSPSVRGVPDRVVVLPGGSVWFIEVKTKGGRMSTLQTAFFHRMDALGMSDCTIVWSKNDVDKWIERVTS